MALKFWTITTNTDRQRVHGWVDRAPPGTRVAFRRPDARSAEQNALMWSRLKQISEQLDWYGEKLSAEDWKDILTAAMRKSRVVPGVDGRVVVLGLHSSNMTRAEMSDLLALIDAFAAERGVTFKEDAP